ncbi:UNVERIFIED_CONTAM: Nuclear pore complex protein [Sesamum angustifolium]|uniref:Nuclear pore complex protein n=1 Tax=Sesamum angustifolium TaxID=2727405 RepID=A0AAW2LE51_9LAMI
MNVKSQSNKWRRRNKVEPPATPPPLHTVVEEREESSGRSPSVDRRRHTTVPTALRGNNNTSSWLTKLVVDPASKLISYGAERFFASVFRKRLPAPPPPQPPEVNDDASGAVEGAIVDNQDSEQEPAGHECSQQINSSSSSRVSELEQLLKQKTFTRHYRICLKINSISIAVIDQLRIFSCWIVTRSQYNIIMLISDNEETASDFGRLQPFASEPLEENRNEGIRSSAVMSTPILNSKVLDDDIASPAELAKAYMGSRPSKVSPSMLGSRRPVGRDEIGLLSCGPFASKSPITSLTKKTSVSLAAPENGFITPRSRGRSAIYNMARTPYSRVHPTSILKGSRLNSNGVAGASMSSPSLSLAEKDEKFDSQPMDTMEQDDNSRSNGFASGLFSEKAGSLKAPFMVSKLSPAEEPMKPTIQQEVNSHSSLISSKRSNLSSPGAVTVGEGNSVIAFPSSKETTAASMSSVVPLPVAAFDKPKEANSFLPLFSFSSKVADKFPALPSDSSKVPESKVESSSSLFGVSPSTGSHGKIRELDEGGHLNPLKAGGVNGKSDTVHFAVSDGPFVSSPPRLFTAASSNDTKQTSIGDAVAFPSSTSTANLVPTDTNTSTSATSSGSIFGFSVKPSSPAAPAFRFGASVDQPAAVSGASATNVSEVADPRTKVELDPSSGNSSSRNPTIAAFAASNPGSSSTFGLASSVSYSTGNNVQGSLFATAVKSPLSGAGSVSEATSVQSVPSASLPLFNMNSSSSFASSLSNSQGFVPNKSFGFSSSASSSDTSTVVPGSGPVSSLPKFGASSTAVSKETAVSSSSGASPAIFTFGLGSSSSTGAVGSGSGAAPPIFSSISSSVSASGINTTSSFSSGTSGIFTFGGISSASSSAANSVSSNGAPSKIFGSNWQSPKSSIFGSTFTSPSPSTGFSFGASSTSAPANAASMVFNSTGASSSPGFLFGSASTSTSALPSPSLSINQPVFGNPSISGFGASPGNNDQMNAEDSMAEDPVQSSAPSLPVFGQPSVSPPPSGFTFGSTVASQANPFMFGGQQNQVAPQNPSPFQASGSLEFNAGGSFSLGSGGGDKSGRKIVKINRNKNRKK